jgi:apolipoprotein N-acyltransferase
MGWHPNLTWLRLGGVVLVAAIAYASLFPADWQIRTGLHWLVEHFLLFSAAAALLCLAWPRPFIVVGLLVALSGLLELLQGLTPDRVPDLATTLSGAGGAIAGALLAQLVIKARDWRRQARCKQI